MLKLLDFFSFTDLETHTHTREYACASNYAKNTHTVTSSKHSVDPNN